MKSQRAEAPVELVTAFVVLGPGCELSYLQLETSLRRVLSKLRERP